MDPLTLDSYQRAARVLLANHLVTATYPDRIALPLIRRWATELREDFAELFGYRLEVTETTARLFPVLDRLDTGRPARTPHDRVFDRRRYAYLALALATLGRAGDQITLSELADHVAAHASRVPGLELETDRAGDRDAFVDAVAWLAARGAVTLADGDAGGWAADPTAGEALYDIDRSVLFALFRPSRALQQLAGVADLLGEDGEGRSAGTESAKAARAVRRALIERPVVYGADLDATGRALLGGEQLVADVEQVTGLRAERRAEGVALIDVSGRFTDVRFPGTGTLAQVALLLIGEIADLVQDLDHPLPRCPFPVDTYSAAAELDAALPRHALPAPIAEPDEPEEVPDDADPPVDEYPVVAGAWVADTVRALADRYGSTFAAQWQADVGTLTTEVVGLLTRLRLVAPVGDGLAVLPALARYRGVVVTVRTRAETELFASAASAGSQ
ncbi:TIGR02678 family protein [Nocardia stercoris]|uniref:TIGR02678 family protein n=1 Tax=Nocardia stercoris TaxID=2483361 RepID=A0A3M2L8N4_9NOCA|nr:TIGR02678 family protein [Nocardia stercoris]RMI32285.1 TIGR02678 family protein [Nocardia stercoris]